MVVESSVHGNMESVNGDRSSESSVHGNMESCEW